MPEVATAEAPQEGMSKIQFRKRFTFDELVAIETAAETDPVVRVIKGNLAAADLIFPDDPMTVQGMDGLVEKGLLTSDRKKAILATP